MKKLFPTIFIIIIASVFSGCSFLFIKDPLAVNVAKEKGYINHFNKPYYEIITSEDIEDVMIYLPKDSLPVRIKMKVSNLEDIIYMKLVSEDGFEIDKILRRVSDIKELGYEQDGYMYEPSIEKNIITLQIYVPSIYLYNGVYKPKLIFSFKRNSRSIQEMISFYFIKQQYFVSHENNGSEENPAYVTLSDYCASSKKANKDFFIQIKKVNENRIDFGTIKDIENSCR